MKPNAEIDVEGAGDIANIGALANNGYFLVGPGTTVNLTNQPTGILDVVAGSTFDLAGAFNAGPNNGFYQLTSVEGTLILAAWPRQPRPSVGH